jgi:hypothetical protein
MRWLSVGWIPCEIHAYGVAPVRGTIYKMAYERCTPGRCTSGRYAYEMAPVRGNVYGRHAYGIASVESTPVRDAPMRCPPMRDTPMRWPLCEARL